MNEAVSPARMQVVIPMSGFGERFRRAGFTVPKPLIEVDGKPIIAHVLDLFPRETDVTFICNGDHLAEPRYQMAALLQELCPTGRICAIAPHRLGPVHAVLQVVNLLDPARPVIVNYCDFSCYWDWDDFRSFVAETRCAGAIPAYRGFHPHSLGSTFYAYLREADGWAVDIQEKRPFTANPIEEYASSGSYYFATATLMREAFEASIAERLMVNGEYYVSMTYKPLMARGLPIAIYQLQHFMQWGTPEDLEVYARWSAAFARLANDPTPPPAHDGMVLLPMAGLGSRFVIAGYDLPKPLIPVSGQPMVVQAMKDLPAGARRQVVMRCDMPMGDTVAQVLRDAFDAVDIVSLSSLTDGQASTCLLALQKVTVDSATPLLIAACDNGMLYNASKLGELLGKPGCDVVVLGVRRHPEALRHPAMFGWIEADAAGRIAGVSVKTPLADPAHDPIVVGAFWFRRAGDFIAAGERLIARGATVNGEYYVDSCINDAIALGLDCHLFEIDHYFGWGTPADLMTFEYWQSCFHKWASHPYRLERDRRVPPEAVAALLGRYAALRPARPT